ncbi:chemotaxis protein CheD [bacterium]|nr:chemotaxis protein CheD [bacterium]
MEGIRKEEPLQKVMMAEYRTGKAPMKMMTMALGSCVGIVLYDKETKIGALAHVMHPSWRNVRNNSNRGKFVDTAIELMISTLSDSGADAERLTAKIFGGARMFDHIVGNRGIVQIGSANITAARNELARLDIPIIVERVGGNKGRTIIFDLSNGSVNVRDADGKEEIL